MQYIQLGGNSWGAAGRRAWSPFDADASGATRLEHIATTPMFG